VGFGVLTEYLAELQKVALLRADEEAGLWSAYRSRGDERSRTRLIVAYQPLVFKVAMQLRLREAILMDMIQEGTVGLIEAVERFDPGRGILFSTFATYRIRGRMLNALRRERSAAPPGEGAPIEDALLERIADPAADKGLAAVEDGILVRQIIAAIDRLPDRERRVLRASFLRTEEPKRAASDLRISLSHFYRLQKQALARIKGSVTPAPAGFAAQE